MSQKDDVVAAIVKEIQDGVTQVYTDKIGEAFDKGEAIGTGPGFTQADIDNAVKAAVDPLNQQLADLAAKDAADVQALTDLKSQTDQALGDLQAKLDAALAAKTADDQVIAGLQASVTQIRSLADQLAAIVLPLAP